MRPNTILLRAYGKHLLDNIRTTTLTPEKNHHLIDEIEELKALLDKTTYRKGVDFVDDNLEPIMEHIMTLVSTTKPPKTFKKIEIGERTRFVRYDKFCDKVGQEERADLVKCLINWKEIRRELWDGLSDHEFEVLSCLVAKTKFKLEHAFITRPLGGADGGIDFGGVYETHGDRFGLVGEAKNHNLPLGKSIVNGELKTWEDELRSFLLTGRHKPQALPDLPPEFMGVDEWRYLITAKNGIEKASLNRIRTATASTMNLEEMLWLVFQDLVVKQPELYREFFSEVEPWPYIPNSMTNWIRKQVHELIQCPPLE